MNEEAKEKKPIVVKVSTIEWLAPTAVANTLPHNITFPLLIEYLEKYGVFRLPWRGFFLKRDGFNEKKLAERIETLLVDEHEYAIKSFRYKVLDWGDAPFTNPKEDETLFVRQ